MDVRPAALIAAGEDRVERHRPIRVRLLDTAKVVLIGDARGVQRITAEPVALPDIDRAAREGRARRRGHDRQRDRERHPVGRAGESAETGADVGAHHVRQTQDGRSVGPVTRERSCRFRRDPAARGASGPAAGVCAGVARRRRTVSPATEQLHAAETRAETRGDPQQRPSIHALRGGPGRREIAMQAAEVVVMLMSH